MLDDFGEQERREGSLRRRLQDRGAPSRNRRRHFVRYEIERKIKRRDGQNRSQRKTAHDSGAPRGGSLPIQRQPFATNARRFFSRHSKGENGAIHFDARGAYRLPRFQRDQARKFFAPFADTVRNGAKDGLLLIARHLARDLKCALRGAHGLFGMHGRGAIG